MLWSTSTRHVISEELTVPLEGQAVIEVAYDRRDIGVMVNVYKACHP